MDTTLTNEQLNAIAQVGRECLLAQEAEKAMVVFSGLVALAPARAAFRLGLGLAHEALGNLVAARDEFTAALVYAPDFPEALFARGSVRLALGDAGGADDTDKARRLVRAAYRGALPG
jgi:tetratricopeptide (TPR) repeat protein